MACESLHLIFVVTTDQVYAKCPNDENIHRYVMSDTLGLMMQ